MQTNSLSRRAMNPSGGNARVVVKVGSSFLTSRRAVIQRKRLSGLAAQLAALRDDGWQPLLVSSGAIASGMQLLGYQRRPDALAQLQAAAAIGQAHLMHAYEVLFRKLGYLTAQILLTRDDFHSRGRYVNARNTLQALLAEKVIPIINENDTVATEEIAFGDNDQLSALVAALVNARLLIMLSDVDGLKGADGTVVREITQMTADVHRLAQGTTKPTSVGGMATKLKAAEMAVRSGIPVVIANGAGNDTLIKIIAGEPVGTWIAAAPRTVADKKHWIAYSCRGCGVITVDAGAKKALMEGGKSLLAGGIVRVEGRFSAGDMVCIIDAEQVEFARGLSNYSAAELRRIQGAKTGDIAALLGQKTHDEVIHRNNLTIIAPEYQRRTAD